MKITVSTEKIGCLGSRRLRGHPIFQLCDRISPQKRKISRNSFCLFIWGPASQVESDKPKKLSKISWHCPFKQTENKKEYKIEYKKKQHLLIFLLSGVGPIGPIMFCRRRYRNTLTGSAILIVLLLSCVLVFLPFLSYVFSFFLNHVSVINLFCYFHIISNRVAP